MSSLRPHKAEPRTPGVLSRGMMALTTRAPLSAITRTRRMAVSAANLARNFATLRPLSLQRASALAEMLLARWSAPPTLSRL